MTSEFPVRTLQWLSYKDTEKIAPNQTARLHLQHWSEPIAAFHSDDIISWGILIGLYLQWQRQQLDIIIIIIIIIWYRTEIEYQ